MIYKLRTVLPLLSFIVILGAVVGYLASKFALYFKPSIPVSTLLSGPAKIVDGNTLVINGQIVRLYGIDAPEYDQNCMNAEGQ